MNISICNACRSADVNGSTRLFDMEAVKSIISHEYPDAVVVIRRTENDDDDEYVVASIFGRVVTAADESALRSVESRVWKIINDYQDSLK